MTRRATRVGALTVGALVAAGSLAAVAATYRLDALRPASSVCAGDPVKVGVRSKTRQRRSFSIRVTTPSGATVFAVSGKVRRAWRTWNVPLAATGQHRVRYVLAGRSRTFFTEVDGCLPPVVLSDNHGGAPAMTLTAGAPGQRISSCLVVTYHASSPASIRLFGSTTGTGLAPHLGLRVTRGSLPEGTPVGSCEGFAPDSGDHGLGTPGLLFDDTVEAFPDSFEAGIVDPAPSWTAGESHAYLLEVTLRDDNAGQGKTAEQTFVWEARG